MIEIEVYGLGAIGCVPSWMYYLLLAILVVGAGGIYVQVRGYRLEVRDLGSPKGEKLKENYNKNLSNKIATLLLVEYVVLVFCSAVVFRDARAERGIDLVPLSSYFCIAENSYLWEVTSINLLNIAMFLPIGFLLANTNRTNYTNGRPKDLGKGERIEVKGYRVSGSPKGEKFEENLNQNCSKGVTWKGALLIALLISASIEVSQFVFRKGLCEVDDVIHNVAGCMLGYGVATLTLTLINTNTDFTNNTNDGLRA